MVLEAGMGFSINLGGLFRADDFVFGWVWLPAEI
jgi:hypothetical protein